MSKRYARRSRDEWGVLIGEFWASGFSRAKFCENNSISASSLDKWCRIISDKPKTIMPHSKPQSGFIPIEIKSESLILSQELQFPPVKITGSSGLVVEFTNGCKLSDLKQVMELLDAA